MASPSRTLFILCVGKPFCCSHRVWPGEVLSECSSWVGILDQRRIQTGQTTIAVAIVQLQALVPLIPRPVIVLADRWYATADFLRACNALGCQVLIRLKRNRKLYRPAVRKSAKGRPPLDGPLLQGSRSETLYGAEAVWMSHDKHGHL